MTKTVTKTPVVKTETKAKGWRIKKYFVDTKAYEASKVELAKAPNQVQIMVKYMAEHYNSADKAEQGKVLCSAAIDKGGLKTVIDPAVLFAYYRKTMESFGLRLA